MANNNPSNLNISFLSYMSNEGNGSIRFNCVGIREPARCKMRISLPSDDTKFCETSITVLIAPSSDTTPGTYKADFANCTTINWPSTGLLGFVPADMYFDLHGGGEPGDTDIDNYQDSIIIFDPGGIFFERLLSLLSTMGRQ